MLRIRVRICGVKSVDVAEQYQKFCMYRSGNDGAEAVIVTDYDLIGRDCVIFVYDWQNI